MCFLIKITLQNDSCTDLIYGLFLHPVRLLHTAVNHCTMRQHRGKAFILKMHRNVRKGLCQMLQKDIYIFCRFRRCPVHIQRIAHDKERDLIFFRILFEIFYYLCRMYRFKGGCKDSQRITYCDPYAFATVIYAYQSVHRSAKLRFLWLMTIK